MTRLSLVLRNLVFTIIVPGAGGVYVPWLILTWHGAAPSPVAWSAIAVIAGGILLYLACVWAFATAGRGTPGLWDAPLRMVAIGPYRWVRNPIYLAAVSAAQRMGLCGPHVPPDGRGSIAGGAPSKHGRDHGTPGPRGPHLASWALRPPSRTLKGAASCGRH